MSTALPPSKRVKMSTVPSFDSLLALQRSRQANSIAMSESTSSIFGKGRIPTDILHLKGRVFLFFELPRELRDLIYDFTCDRKKRIRETWPHEAYLYNLPDPSLLLLNRQFRTELLERIPLHATMTLDIPRLEPLHKPLKLLSVAHVDLRVDISHDLGSVRFTADGTKIWRLSTLRPDIVKPLIDASECLKSLSISFYMSSPGNPPSLDARDEGRLNKCQDVVGELMTFNNGVVKGLELYLMEKDKAPGFPPWPTRTKDAVLWMRYSFERGRMERVGA